MSKLLLTLLALGTLSQTALANEQIARDNQCFKCHAIDSKKKAPSFQYLAKNSNAAEIRDVVRNGITTFWGKEKMPANKTISDADLKALTQWILQQ
ncbi:MAG: c-type cytochrome [Formosimonas sp.]